MATKYYKWSQCILEMTLKHVYQMAINYVYQHLQLQRHSKIYPNWDFWYENMPSGSPGYFCYFQRTALSKQLPKGRRFGESGNPDADLDTETAAQGVRRANDSSNKLRVSGNKLPIRWKKKQATFSVNRDSQLLQFRAVARSIRFESYVHTRSARFLWKECNVYIFNLDFTYLVCLIKKLIHFVYLLSNHSINIW
jgi:hypothetical protein